MEVRRFFADNPISGDTIVVTGDEHHHIRSVNRLKPGHRLELIDGNGNLHHAEISYIQRNQTVAVVKETVTQPQPPVKTIIATSILKTKAMHLLIEKLTEMGVDEIRPIIFDRTDVPFAHSMLEKWRRIAAQSLKVNKKLWATRFHPAVRLPELIDYSSNGNVSTRLLLDIQGPKLSTIAWQPPVLAVIGPPGDYTPTEKQLLLTNNYTPLAINSHILKTETAALSATALITALTN